MPKTFTLPEPITVVGDNDTKEVKEITLREPTRQDFRACGESPDIFYTVYYAGGGERYVTDYKLLRQYMDRLVDKTLLISLDDIPIRSLGEIGLWIAENLAKLKN